jgi:hypothetical protein
MHDAMPLNLPEPVVDALRDRYLAGVADAQAGFGHLRSSEDALTGALGWELSRRPEFVVPVGGAEYVVKVDFHKPRSGGLNSPERLYGTDGIFQLEVIDERGNVVGKKGLPFQAKTNWRGTNSTLAGQSADINRSLRGGIVVNFTPSGYEACTTKAAARAKGKYGLVKQAGEIKPLGQILANDFLNCTVGTVGLLFDIGTERFVGADGLQIAPANAITTVVRRRLR